MAAEKRLCKLRRPLKLGVRLRLVFFVEIKERKNKLSAIFLSVSCTKRFLWSTAATFLKYLSSRRTYLTVRGYCEGIKGAR